MCTCTHTHRRGTRLHTHVPLRSSRSHTCPEVTPAHIHAHMEMEKGRSRQGGAELRKGQLPPTLDPGEEGSCPPGHMAEADPSIQPPEAKVPARPSGLAAGELSIDVAKRTGVNVWGKCLLCARHSAKSLGSLALCLRLTPTCEKGSC